MLQLSSSRAEVVRNLSHPHGLYAAMEQMAALEEADLVQSLHYSCCYYNFPDDD